MLIELLNLYYHNQYSYVDTSQTSSIQTTTLVYSKTENEIKINNLDLILIDNLSLIELFGKSKLNLKNSIAIPERNRAMQIESEINKLTPHPFFTPKCINAPNIVAP